ncbi:MAG TPA: adenylosuccinate lyase [Vampirovibrionales bacterium]
MIERYTTPEMKELWSEENKFKIWQEVEIAACKAWNEEGKIPTESLQKICESKPVDPERVYAIDEKVHHDVIAFLTAWNEQPELEGHGRFIHLGLTSSDLIDTALSVMIKRTGETLLAALDELLDNTKQKAFEHKNTYTIGRSHGVHGEPTTFGLKLLNFYQDLKRVKDKLIIAGETISVGMFSGPVGTYSNLTPIIEEKACKHLDLKPCGVSTQVISRERHADFVYALASLGAVIEKIATELRHLQRTEVLEVEEPFYSGQKGSSSMPHKRNPWRSENLCGIARLLRSYLTPALENIALWHERDISHSSTERVFFPDAANLAHFMLRRLNTILKDLRVYPENMKRNLFLYGGVVHSQKVLIRLVEKGMSREDAYKIVQEHALNAWNKEEGDFKQAILNDEKVVKMIGKDELEQAFEIDNDLKFIDQTFERVLG